MPRSRMIKPEFWDDEKLARVSRDARLTYEGLWTYSDDYGVVKGNLVWLKSKIFPYDTDIKPAQFQRWIEELERERFILPFEAEGEKYLFIKNFQKHQNVDHPSKQRNPEPPPDILSRESREPSRGPRSETETETETETEAIVELVLACFNALTGQERGSEEAKKLIRSRISDGRTLSNFLHVIDTKTAQWFNDQKMRKYLRPSTLFRPSNFEDYLNEPYQDPWTQMDGGKKGDQVGENKESASAESRAYYEIVRQKTSELWAAAGPELEAAKKKSPEAWNRLHDQKEREIISAAVEYARGLIYGEKRK